MTQKLYETDAYVQEFTAAVLSCTPAKGGYAVVLDRTAFFPEGGGQPCDLGTLGTAKVTDVHTDGATITHTTDAPLEPGTAVTGRIDWPRRLDAMQQHTGEHILSGTLHRLFGAENVGFHIGTPYVRTPPYTATSPTPPPWPPPSTAAKRSWTAPCGWWKPAATAAPAAAPIWPAPARWG